MAKRKTALQSAIEHFEKLSLEGSNQAYVVSKYLKTLLPQEKQDLIEFGELCFNEAYCDSEDNVIRDNDAENLFNQQFENENT